MRTEPETPKSKILFVDDEQYILDGIRRQLHSKYEVHIALGGKEGLSVISSKGPFQVIVADMRMPEMDGIEFLNRAKEFDPYAILMMLTGNADRQTAVDAVDRGHVFHFLTKPCRDQELIKAIDGGIDLFQLQEKIKRIDSFTRKSA